MLRLELMHPHTTGGKRRSIRFVRTIDYGWMEAYVLTPKTVMEELTPRGESLVNRKAAELEALPAAILLVNPKTELPDTEVFIGVRIKKRIPKEILLNCWRIFYAGYGFDKNEWTCYVRLSQTEDKWDIVIPRQYRSGAFCGVAAEVLTRDVLQPGWWVVGNFHSHPFGGGGKFLSGTDRDNVDVILSAVAGSFNFNPNIPVFGEMALQMDKLMDVETRFVVEEIPPLDEVIDPTLPADIKLLFDAECAAVKVTPDYRSPHRHSYHDADEGPNMDFVRYMLNVDSTGSPLGEHTKDAPPNQRQVQKERSTGRKRDRRKGVLILPSSVTNGVTPTAKTTTQSGIANAFDAPDQRHNMQLILVD